MKTFQFIISRSIADVIREPLPFVTAVLAVAIVCVAFNLIAGSKDFFACITPPWVQKSTALFAWKRNLKKEEQLQVISTLRSSTWFDKVEEISGEEVVKDVENLTKHFGSDISEVDASMVPGYLEATFSRKCVQHLDECFRFVESIAKSPAIDHYYSGLNWAVEANQWYETFRKYLLNLGLFFLMTMVVIIFLLVRLSFNRRTKEIYLWDLLGVSPLVKRLYCYGQACLMVVLGWPLSLLFLYGIKERWHRFEKFFAENRHCWPSNAELGFYSVGGIIFVLIIVCLTIEWAFRQGWKSSAKGDWTWSD